MYRKYARITLANGSVKRISATGKTEAEALRKLAKIEAEYVAGIRTINSNTTLRQWGDEWLEVYKKPTVTAKTHQQLQTVLENYFYEELGKLPIGSITKIQLQKCLNEMYGMSESYCKRARNTIRAVFNAALEDGIINRSPAIGLVIPKTSRTEPRRALTEDEKKIFLQAIENHPYGAYFGIMYACGLRPQEARALLRSDVNYKNGTVTIDKAVESGTKEIKGPKSESGNRTIPLPDWFIPILKRQPININRYLFTTNGGGPITEQAHKRAWSSLIREMNILAGAELYRNQIVEPKIADDISPYYLRHTFCTELAEKDVNIKTAQYLMGHSDISITAKYYTHVTDKMIDEARKKINAI